MANNLKQLICIVPCFNEEASLEQLIKSVNKIRSENQHKFSLDLMLINDGSDDGTQSIIERHSKKSKHIFYRNFANNTGHQSAIRAGLDVSTNYDAVIMLDADLQHPPEYIPVMFKEWQDKDVYVVQMLRADSRKEAGTFKFVTSKAYYWLLNSLSDLKLEYGASDFRLLDRAVVKTVAASPEKDLFLRGYFSWLNVKRSSLTYKPNQRYAGSSKYTFRKMLKLAKRGILQFSEKPLRLSTNIGIIIAAISLLYGIYLIFSYASGHKNVSGWTSLMVVTLFCFGINFVLLGFIGRYLAHSIEIQKKRPDYIVSQEKLPV